MISVLTLSIYFFVIKTEINVECVVSPKFATNNDPYSFSIYVNNRGLSSIHIDTIDITWNRTDDGSISNEKLGSGSSGWKSSDVPGNTRGLVFQIKGTVDGSKWGHWEAIVVVNTNLGSYLCTTKFAFIV